MTKSIFKLNGLHCSACKKLTEKRINTIKGVKNVNVNIDTGVAEISADSTVQKKQVEEVLLGSEYSVV